MRVALAPPILGGGRLTARANVRSCSCTGWVGWLHADAHGFSSLYAECPPRVGAKGDPHQWRLSLLCARTKVKHTVPNVLSTTVGGVRAPPSSATTTRVLVSLPSVREHRVMESWICGGGALTGVSGVLSGAVSGPTLYRVRGFGYGDAPAPLPMSPPAPRRPLWLKCPVNPVVQFRVPRRPASA